MLTNEQRQDLFTAICAMPEKSAFEKARKLNALRHFENLDHDDGAVGRIREILAKSTYSKQRNFAKQGATDCFVWVTVDGKPRKYRAERKTNGGRIESLLSANAPAYVVYSMDICNASTSNQRRVIEPIVLKTEFFLSLLEECNATKCTNGKHPETAIQVSSKKLFLALADYPIPYDPNARYTPDDFDF